MKFLRWLTDSMIRTYTALAILGVTVLTGSYIVSAANTYEVHNVPDMFLNVGISSTATTGIQIAGPIRNGVRQNFPTTSGGILEFKFASTVELIHYNSATVNNSTKVTTLVGVTRDVYWNDCTKIQSNNNGKGFPKGATVRLVDDCRLWNFKANKDRANVFSASGSITFTGSGSLGMPLFPTSAALVLNQGTTQTGRLGCIPSSSECFFLMNGVWQRFTDSSSLDGRYVNTAGDTMTGALTITVAGGSPGNTLVVDTSTLIVDATNNRVGIGTTVPGNALEVIGTISGSVLHGRLALTTSGSLRINGVMTGATAIYGPASPPIDCDNALSHKVLWDAATGKFTCGTDTQTGTGITVTSGDNRYVNTSGDTMTGELLLKNNFSGSSVQVGARQSRDKIVRILRNKRNFNDLVPGAGACSMSTLLLLTGARVGDTCIAGVNGDAAVAMTAGPILNCYVTSTGVVTMQLCRVGAGNFPASSKVFSATVLGFENFIEASHSPE